MDNTVRQHQGMQRAVSQAALAGTPAIDRCTAHAGGTSVPPPKAAWLNGPSYRQTLLSRRLRKTA